METMSNFLQYEFAVQSPHMRLIKYKYDFIIINDSFKVFDVCSRDLHAPLTIYENVNTNKSERKAQRHYVESLQMNVTHSKVMTT